MTTKSKEQVQAEMDAAAEQAEQAFKRLNPDHVATVAGWMRAFRPSAGFKRLGRILLGESWRKSAKEGD